MAPTALAVIGLAVFGVYQWLSVPVDRAAPSDIGEVDFAERIELAKLRVEVIRNALTVGAGLGGLAALALAFRRQHHVEHQQRHHEHVTRLVHDQREREHEQREKIAAVTEHDALERRITELRIQAVAQLGSESAAVRIGGLHNLERLASQNPGLQQIVLEEICAYLRLPFNPLDQTAEDAVPGSQEREVRLVAQSIFNRHLNKSDLAQDYWPHSQLNLAGATLDTINFHKCQLHGADFRNARFIRTANFRRTTFHGWTRFGGAKFVDEAVFEGSSFADMAIFDNAEFDRTAQFVGVEFHGPAMFADTRFHAAVTFKKAAFKEYVHCEGMTLPQSSRDELPALSHWEAATDPRDPDLVRFVPTRLKHDSDVD